MLSLCTRVKKVSLLIKNKMLWKHVWQQYGLSWKIYFLMLETDKLVLSNRTCHDNENIPYYSGYRTIQRRIVRPGN